MNVWLSLTSVPGSEQRRERLAKTKDRLNLSISVCALKQRTIPPAGLTPPTSNNKPPLCHMLWVVVICVEFPLNG